MSADRTTDLSDDVAFDSRPWPKANYGPRGSEVDERIFIHVKVSMTPKDLARLDRMAALRSMSRAELVRDLIRKMRRAKS